jgi:galactonate dehydratase
MTAADTICALRIHNVEVSERTTWTFVEVQTAAGYVGIGEASLHYGRDEIAAHLKRLAAVLDREPVAAALAALAAIADAGFLQTVAICAVDQALADLLAQHAGRSIAEMLSSAPRTTIAAYANINSRTRDRSPEGFARCATEAVTRGNNALKIAPFDRVQPQMSRSEILRYLERGMQRIAAVRGAVGPQVRLMIDCHWRLNTAAIGDVLRCAAEHGVYWIETPFPEEASRFDDIVRARAQANELGIRLAGAEMKVGMAQFRPVLERGLYDIVMPDIIFVGGYAAFMQVAEAAVEGGAEVSPHNPNGPVCHAHSVQLSAAIPGFMQLEMQFDESPLFMTACSGAVPLPHGGAITVPRDAGLGLHRAASVGRAE